MKIVKAIVNVLTTIIIGVGGLILVLYLFGIVPYVVLSGSMEPTIDTGSLCFINKNADYEDVKEKDIIAFKLSDGTLVTHRAIEITETGIVTKGDNNDGANSNQVRKDNFVGKNLFWVPKVGYAVKAFQSTKGKIIVITSIVLLFAAGFLFGENKNKEVKEN